MYIRQVDAHWRQFITKHYLNNGFHKDVRIGLAHYKQGGCLIHKKFLTQKLQKKLIFLCQLHIQDTVLCLSLKSWAGYMWKQQNIVEKNQCLWNSSSKWSVSLPCCDCREYMSYYVLKNVSLYVRQDTKGGLMVRMDHILHNFHTELQQNVLSLTLQRHFPTWQAEFFLLTFLQNCLKRVSLYIQLK